jgi:hypothetical protein
MRSVVDRNFVMRRKPVFELRGSHSGGEGHHGILELDAV